MCFDMVSTRLPHRPSNISTTVHLSNLTYSFTFFLFFYFFLQKQALRTIAIAHCDFTKEEIPDPSQLDDDWGYTQKCTLQAIVGIIDPLRGDVVEAVRTCQSAGIMVRNDLLYSLYSQ